MSILVTGGTGFVGADVVKNLVRSGHEVVVYDNCATSRMDNLLELKDKLKFVQGDILDLGLLIKVVKEYEVNRIVHAGAVGSPAQAIANPVLAVNVNIQGTLNVLRTAQIMNIDRIVSISSEEVYGEFQKEVIDEEHSCNPSTIYGVTKVACEGMARQFKTLFGVDTINIRTSWVYGPGLPRSRPPKSIIDSVLHGKEAVVPCGADHKLDQTYIDDCTQGIILALFTPKPKYDTYNIATGQMNTMSQMVEIIHELIPASRIKVGSGLLKYIGEMEIPQKGALSIDRAKNDLGYLPKYDLHHGLKAYIEFLKKDIQ